MSKLESKIRIKDILEKAGISVVNVYHVLCNRDEVEVETREEDMTIFIEMGYTPYLFGKFLEHKKRDKIAEIRLQK